MAHPNKIAVGGHSYGAFMTANLLAHAPHLFCCGIARSGAYNRTLTPFGFQVAHWLEWLKFCSISNFFSAAKWTFFKEIMLAFMAVSLVSYLSMI